MCVYCLLMKYRMRIRWDNFSASLRVAQHVDRMRYERDHNIIQFTRSLSIYIICNLYSVCKWCSLWSSSTAKFICTRASYAIANCACMRLSCVIWFTLWPCVWLNEVWTKWYDIICGLLKWTPISYSLFTDYSATPDYVRHATKSFRHSRWSCVPGTTSTIWNVLPVSSAITGKFRYRLPPHRNIACIFCYGNVFHDDICQCAMRVLINFHFFFFSFYVLHQILRWRSILFVRK